MQDKEFDPSLFIKNAKIEGLNEMQVATLQSVPANQEIILSAPTGSGKTIAFLLLLLKLIPKDHRGTFALIISPTRELALQIDNVFHSLKTGFKITVCYGGHKREIEENNLAEAPTVIVGTPGRLGDHIRRGNIKTDTIRLLVLDEFDKSLELGFTEEMKFIIENLTSVQFKILISATPDSDLPDFLKMTSPKILDFSGFMEHQIDYFKIPFRGTDKNQKLHNLLCQIGNRKAIIFVNEKNTITQLKHLLKEEGFAVADYHGSMEQSDREISLAKFRNGSVNFLVTTDLASRGLDITNVRYIVHYDLPETSQIFLHRNGRTARMESSGDIILLIDQTKESPDFLPPVLKELRFKENLSIPPKSEWGTIFISAGKKNKINKIDIAGFLMQKAGLKKEDVGLIEVKDFYSFAAIRRSSMNYLLGLGKDQKIKNQKLVIAAAK